MKEIELFYLTGCPYCQHARRAIDELQSEEPSYRDIRIRWIEENQEPEMAGGRDYYYVPTIYFDGKKLYEAQPGQDFDTVKDNIRRSFEEVMK